MPIGLGMDSAALIALGRTQQARLTLLDWRIEFAWGTPQELVGAFGRCEWQLPKKTARITILPEQYRKTLTPYESVAATVLHELLHLHLAPLTTRARLNLLAVEQAIDAIVRSVHPTKTDISRAGRKRPKKH